jgi:nicotinamide riboside kinase
MYDKGQISDWVMDFAENVFTKIIDKYDYIFYLTPEFDMEDDGVRSVDEGFQMQIVKLFEQYILECEVPVIHLTGTVSNRIKQIKETINE